MTTINNVLALDIGAARIGLARCNLVAKLPEPIGFLKNDSDFDENFKSLLNEYDIDIIVVGLPRNMQGSETQQSMYVREFVHNKIQPAGLPIHFQDETLSSVQAEESLQKSKKQSQKGDVDSYAAAIILQDYIQEAQQ